MFTYQPNYQASSFRSCHHLVVLPVIFYFWKTNKFKIKHASKILLTGGVQFWEEDCSDMNSEFLLTRMAN
jgi:hypothetical protein